MYHVAGRKSETYDFVKNTLNPVKNTLNPEACGFMLGGLVAWHFDRDYVGAGCFCGLAVVQMQD